MTKKEPIFDYTKEPTISKVVNTYKLSKDQIIELNDFQMSSADAEGNITLVDFKTAEKEEGDMSRYVIRPGAWLVDPKNGMAKLEVKDETYFETTTSVELMHHLSRLTDRVDVYRKLKIPAKRGILLGSEPGQGKSSLIRYFCKKVSAMNPKLCILKIDSDGMNWSLIQRMFMEKPQFDVEQVILIIEDIGGADLYNKTHRIDPSLLNFLDGNDSFNNYVTLIVATTNYLDELGPTINDRPGRFDVVVQVAPPKDAEIELIVGSLLERPLTDPERKAMFGKGFTPAYCSEIVIRSMLYDITIEESAKQLTDQRKKSKSKGHSSTEGGSVGFGGGHYLD